LEETPKEGNESTEESKSIDVNKEIKKIIKLKEDNSKLREEKDKGIPEIFDKRKIK